MIVRTSRKTETFIMIVVPLSSIKEFIAIEFIGSTAAYMIIKKITHVEVLAMAGSFAASVILKKMMLFLRSLPAGRYAYFFKNEKTSILPRKYPIRMKKVLQSRAPAPANIMY